MGAGKHIVLDLRGESETLKRSILKVNFSLLPLQSVTKSTFSSWSWEAPALRDVWSLGRGTATAGGYVCLMWLDAVGDLRGASRGDHFVEGCTRPAGSGVEHPLGGSGQFSFGFCFISLCTPLRFGVFLFFSSYFFISEWKAVGNRWWREKKKLCILVYPGWTGFKSLFY